MKKKFFFLPLLAAMALVGCSKEESEDAGGNNGGADTHYLAVSIVSSPNAGGRAETGTDAVGSPKFDNQYGSGTDTFEDGLPAENDIKKVRFYFFRQTGAPVNVKGSVNYQDFTPNTLGDDHDNTVSDKLETVLVVNTAAGDVLPELILAVINPPSTLPDQSLNLTFFRDRFYDYTEYTTTGATPGNGFVMSNSVFVNDQKKIENVTVIDPKCYAKTEDEAKTEEKALKIYVERCVAKVRLNVVNSLRPKTAKDVTDAYGNLLVQDADGSTTHSLTKLKYKETVTENGVEKEVEKDLKIRRTVINGADTTIYDEQVYAELMGWNVSADRPKSYLLKHLDDKWRNSNPDGMGAAWNLAALHRCFWAAYCTQAGPDNVFHDFENSYKRPFEGDNFTYCNENAQQLENTMVTKVIVPAVLCDKDANPLVICEFAGNRFVDDASLTNMKDLVLSMMMLGQNEFWTEDGTVDTDGNKDYRQMGRQDIEFKPLYETAAPGNAGRYYVKAVLTAEAAARTWIKRNPNVKEEETWTSADFDEIMKDFQNLRIWKDGKTYYYLDIPHLGAAGSNTEFGVVRNHIYDITIDGIYGLGTPVFNPDQVIIPEPVNPDEVYIAAQVNILSWRLIKKNVTIDTGK